MSNSFVPPIPTQDILRAIGTPVACTGITLEIHSEISEATYALLFFAYHAGLDTYREGTTHYVLTITECEELSDMVAVLNEAGAEWSIDLVLVRE